MHSLPIAYSIALLSLVPTVASATSIGHLNSGSQSNAGLNLEHIASNNLITTDEADTYETISNAEFNALSPSELAAMYDILVFPWFVETDADADWTTRIEPFLAAGGSILWEDPFNIGEISGASGLDLTGSNIYSSSEITLDPPFGDDGAEGFYHIHYSIVDYVDATWNCWSTDDNSDCHGVNAEFPGGGRMVVGVSDNLYHPSFSSGIDDDHMQLTINQLNWLDTGSITGEPPAVPIPATLPLILGGTASLLVLRRRKG